MCLDRKSVAFFVFSKCLHGIEFKYQCLRHGHYYVLLIMNYQCNSHDKGNILCGFPNEWPGGYFNVHKQTESFELLFLLWASRFPDVTNRNKAVHCIQHIFEDLLLILHTYNNIYQYHRIILFFITSYFKFR